MPSEPETSVSPKPPPNDPAFAAPGDYVDLRLRHDATGLSVLGAWRLHTWTGVQALVRELTALIPMLQAEDDNGRTQT